MPGSVLLLAAVGCLIGVTTVLFGFGGGFVTVPAVYGIAAAAGDSDAMHTAVATSTAVMIVNAGWATFTTVRLGRLPRGYLWPIIAYLGLGAVLGALAADRTPEPVLHVLFVAYLAAAIADGVMRGGFIDRHPGDPEPLSAGAATIGGVGIGAVAAFLGVGGSVLTVPLLRRRGAAMIDAAALANPLSIPIAIAGTAVYALAGQTGVAPGQVGHVSVVAAAALLGGSLPTIVATRHVAAGRIPDRVHAVAYLTLLGIVLAAMTATLWF